MLGGNLEKAGLPAILGPKTLVLRFGSGYNLQREYCQDPARLARTEEALRKATGHAWSIRIDLVSNDAATLSVSAADTEKSQTRYRRQRTEALQEPLVKKAAEVLGAQIVSMDEGFGAAPQESTERASMAEVEAKNDGSTADEE
jgi:DNA polymerase-3 subunit gamma/tau